MRATILSIYLPAAMLLGCASNGGDKLPASEEAWAHPPGFSILALIPGDNPAFAFRALTERAPGPVSARGPDEVVVQDDCNAHEPRIPGKDSPGALLAPIPNQGVLWRPALFDPQVGAALQRHVTVRAQSARRPFYSDPERRNFEPAWRCFRFAQFERRDDVAPSLDFVGQLRLGDSGDYLQVRPLRLYAAAARGARSLALGLRLEAVWMQGNIGKRESVFEPVLLALLLKPGGEEVHYFSDKYWEHYPILPLAPVSVDLRNRPSQTAPATVTVTVVEIRDANTAAQSLLPVARIAEDQIGALVAAALVAR